MILKVCGITNQGDADVAVDAGANAIGFNFYRKSPRYISPELAKEIVTPMGVLRVGVFVNEHGDEVERLHRLAKLHRAQLHGEEDLAEFPGGLVVWKAIRVKDGYVDVRRYHDQPIQALVVDGPAGELYGGAGKTFDWSLVREYETARIIVAGGLDASNVARAVELARPWGVDACSKIESSPGKKDHQKMKEYLWAARMALQT